jgi:hypothetical protein
MHRASNSACGLQPNWRTAAALVVIAVFCVLEVGKGVPQSFIYFQF